MKTTKQRLLNIVITMSVAVNLVLLGGVGYIALMKSSVDHLYTDMNMPVIIYAPKVAESPAVATPSKSPATQ